MKSNQTSEKIIERHLAESVKQKGGMCIKLLSDYLTGLPDRLCLFPGQKAVFVELKSTGEKPRKIQVFVHNRLRALGFRVEVIDSLAGVNELIDNIYNADRK